MEKNRPVNWLPEWFKSVDTSEAATEEEDYLIRSVRLRRVNPSLVIPEQCMLFLRPGDEDGSGGTLSGNKLKVYVVLKIMKKITDEDITSFTLKFAVDRALAGRQYETADVGFLLNRVLNFWSLRGRFKGVADALWKIGVNKIEVTDEGLEFCFRYLI